MVAIIRSQEGCIHTQYTNAFLSQSCIISCIFLYIYTRICRPRNIGPPSRIHNNWLRKMMKGHTKCRKELEGIWNDDAHLIGLLEQMFWDNFFPLMRSCIFKSSSWCFYTSLSVFKVDLPKQTPELYTENEWPNFKEYIVAVEEEEWDKNRTTWTSLEIR